MSPLNRTGRRMPPIRFRPGRSPLRLAPLWLAAGALRVSGACRRQAGHAEGADALKALIAKFFPAAQTGAGAGCDGEAGEFPLSRLRRLSALNALLAETGVSYDPAVISYKAVEQDDGNWRVLMTHSPVSAFTPRTRPAASNSPILRTSSTRTART